MRGCNTRRDCEEGESCQSGRCMVLPLSSCGNGTLEPGEACDFGEANADTGYCTTSCRTAVCGDGLVWQGTEECDDGNSEDADSCTSDCRANVCGDGIVNRGVEACDSGQPLGNMTCDESCRPISCGNGELDPEQGEVCDHGDRNHPSLDCLPNCLPARCGDGFRNVSAHSDEECDLGSGIDGNTESAACTPGCKRAYCGDGMVWEGHEECDDGNEESGDGCSETCGVEYAFCCITPGEACVHDETPHPSEPCLWCNATTETATSWSPMDPGEACEDGNPCTVSDACDGAGTCVSGGPRTCDDGNPCTVGACNPDAGPDNPCGFSPVQDNRPCNNELFCDGSPDACQDGVCQPASRAPCSGATPVCDETMNQCHQCSNSSHCPPSAPYCVDYECLECTAASHCADDGEPCTTAYCDAGQCRQQGCTSGVCTPVGCRECNTPADCINTAAWPPRARVTRAASRVSAWGATSVGPTVVNAWTMVASWQSNRARHLTAGLQARLKRARQQPGD